MTLHSTPVSPIPEETVRIARIARIARAAAPRGNVYVQMRDVLGSIYTDQRFADLFAPRGRPVVPPWRLALVTVMQFAEGLSDRQAAEAVRVRIDWKYALGLELTDPGFDYRVLCEFRARLAQGGAEQRLLDTLLEACKAHGLLKARGRQRTDSTHVLGALRVLSRLERAAETLRATLNALATVAPDWLQAQVPPEWYDRYSRRIEDSRLPRGLAAQQAYAAQVGSDAGRLLDLLASSETPAELRSLPAAQLLQQFWEQEYVVDGEGRYAQRDSKAAPAASQHLESPYETEARFATKRGRRWTGYKVHVTEVGDNDAPHLLTQVAPTSAPATDVRQLPLIHEALSRCGLLPTQHLVDAGSTRAGNVVESRNQHQIDWVGPVDTDHRWQARVTGGYVTERFQIDWDHQQAICPRDRRSIRWCETHTARKRTMIHLDFDPADCLPCPDRALGTRAETGSRARSVTWQSPAEYEALLAGRARQQTQEVAQTYARRAGIAGTVSQGVRAFGLRRARSRGLRKTHLQHVATAVAMNFVRLTQWLNGAPMAPTRHSRFARLASASCIYQQYPNSSVNWGLW
jgi:transposase